MNSTDDKRLIVALVGTEPKITDQSLKTRAIASPLYNKDWRSIRLHSRNSPCNTERRCYAVLGTRPLDDHSIQKNDFETTNRLCELQVLPACVEGDENSLSSIMIKSNSAATVVGNGKIYVLTYMDPLFFLLPGMISDESKSPTSNAAKDCPFRDRWQPLDQILSPLDPMLKSCIDPSQIGHLYSSIQLGPNELFHKFSEERALCWLQRKHDALNNFFLQHRRKMNEEKVAKSTSSFSGGGAGAFTEGFFMPGGSWTAEVNSQDTANSNDSEQTARLAREHSIQIICSYLSEHWRGRFLNHLKESPQILLSPKQRATKRAQSEVSVSSLPSSSDWRIQAQGRQALPMGGTTKKETGGKTLATVNIKGMKKMSAFFEVVSNKKKKNS